MSLGSIVPAALLVVATLAGACASSGGKGAAAESGSGCALRPQDSTFAIHMPLYRDCAVERKVQKLTMNIAPEYRLTSNGCVSAELEFVVTADGKVDATTARVVRTTTPAYAEAVLAILPRFRYEPAKRDGVAVAQIVTEKHEAITKTVVAIAGTRPNPGRAGPGC
ncbi:MAG: hypothetical protein ABIT20_02610 [Gemmatimonadaceae bacterium]